MKNKETRRQLKTVTELENKILSIKGRDKQTQRAKIKMLMEITPVKEYLKYGLLQKKKYAKLRRYERAFLKQEYNQRVNTLLQTAARFASTPFPYSLNTFPSHGNS